MITTFYEDTEHIGTRCFVEVRPPEIKPEKRGDVYHYTSLRQNDPRYGEAYRVGGKWQSVVKYIKTGKELKYCYANHRTLRSATRHLSDYLWRPPSHLQDRN